MCKGELPGDVKLQYRGSGTCEIEYHFFGEKGGKIIWTFWKVTFPTKKREPRLKPIPKFQLERCKGEIWCFPP